MLHCTYANLHTTYAKSHIDTAPPPCNTTPKPLHHPTIERRMPFILHIQSQSCAACGRRETLSTLYQAEALPHPGRAQKLLPCHSIGPSDPIHRVELPLRTTPTCATCSIDREMLDPEAWARWEETLARKSQNPSTTNTQHQN